MSPEKSGFKKVQGLNETLSAALLADSALWAGLEYKLMPPALLTRAERVKGLRQKSK